MRNRPETRWSWAAMLVLMLTTVSAVAQPVPLLKEGSPASWWFVFKLNGKAFPGCDGDAKRICRFGGEPVSYKTPFGQQFVYASDAHPSLERGSGCVGDTIHDPVGATFDQIYNGSYFHVVWNDQFYDDPKVQGCSKQGCPSPWGHSKGMLAWDDSGNGVVLQVTTPSWPGAGSATYPRPHDGNTLGCVKDNDVSVSQHFFALRLTKPDVVAVLQAIKNASVVTLPNNHQLVVNGGPSDIQALVASLGVKSKSKEFTNETLSSGVVLLSKPSNLAVPPWQFVSASLGGIPLRAATWWASPRIYSTTKKTKVSCWSPKLGKPGPVAIALAGTWNGTNFSLKSSPQADGNHAKVGVSESPDEPYAVFGDMNQQGTLSGTNCKSSQNGRGGLFFAVRDAALAQSVAALIAGDTAPTKAPAAKKKPQR